LWSRKFVHVGGGVGAADGEGDGAALSVAETAGLGIVPGTPGDIAGDVPTAGEVTAPGAAGEATPAAPGGGTGGVRAVAGVCPGAGGGGGGG